MLDPTIKPRSQAEDIRKIATDLGYPTDWIWAWDNYKPMIVELSRSLNLRRHVEIGAGRDPLFLMDEALTHGFDVTLSDISARELSLAPEGYEKVECDIAAPDAIDKLGREAYDLAYCRMVMEHVPDVAAMWRNVCGALGALAGALAGAVVGREVGCECGALSGVACAAVAHNVQSARVVRAAAPTHRMLSVGRRRQRCCGSGRWRGRR